MTANGANGLHLPSTQKAAQFHPKDQSVYINEVPVSLLSPLQAFMWLTDLSRSHRSSPTRSWSKSEQLHYAIAILCCSSPISKVLRSGKANPSLWYPCMRLPLDLPPRVLIKTGP